MRCPECGHELPVGKRKCIYCGTLLSEKGAKRDTQISQDPGVSEEYISLKFSMARTKRRTPMNRLTLILIFLASAALMGFILWLIS